MLDVILKIYGDESIKLEIIRPKMIEWAKDFSLPFEEIIGSGYDLHLTIKEKNLPEVDIIHRNFEEKIIVVISKLNVGKDHINTILLKSPEETSLFLSRIREMLLLMNVEYISREKIGELPTVWEVLYKIHINELSPQNLWNAYVKIKNAVIWIITYFQQEVINMSSRAREEKLQKIISDLKDLAIHLQGTEEYNEIKPAIEKIERIYLRFIDKHKPR